MPSKARRETLKSPMNPEIVFVTGKGGVGKSTVAASLALKKAQAGARVLLAEIGDQSFYQDAFGLKNVAYQPVPLAENLSLALWSGQECLREYILYLIKVETLYRLFFENKVMRAFINIAPGLTELAILGKATSAVRKHGPPMPFDSIIVDAYSTGHFLALLKVPAGMAEAVKFGPMGDQSRSIDRILHDSKVCKFLIVTVPEELPVKEAEELYEALKSQFGIEAEILVNKTSRADIPAAEFTAAAKSREEAFRQFTATYAHHIEIQEGLLGRINALTAQVQLLPQVWEHEFWSVLKKLAGILT